MVGFSLRATVLSVVALCLMIPYGKEAQRTSEPATVVQGTVLVETAEGPTAAAGARVIAESDFLIVSTIADSKGKFRFSDLGPGTYAIKTTYFGLNAEQDITLEAGTVVRVALQLKPPDL